MTPRRAPRIAASLRERHNELRPIAPWPERLLGALGANPSFVESVLGDLAEERNRRTMEQGAHAADWWYAREAARSIPHLVWNALRHGGRDGRMQLAGVLAALAVPPAIVLALVLRAAPPATLVFDGQRGGEINGVVLNSRHPVQLVTHALDARGRKLPAGTVRYRWLVGGAMTVTPSGVVTCSEPGDAELLASAGAVSTKVIVRCRPVSYVGGEMVIPLIAGEPGRELPFTARAPSGRPEHLLAGDLRVQDSSVAVLNRWIIRPVAPGKTVVTVKIGDGQTRFWVNVYERVRTFAGLRSDQRFVSAPVRIAVGDSIRWPLPTGDIWLRFTPDSNSRLVPKITVHGQLTCVPAFGMTDQARCRVDAPGAWVRITHPRGSRGEVVGNLALERRDP